MKVFVDKLFEYVSIRVVPVRLTVDSAVFNIELDDETIIAIAVDIDKEDQMQITSGSDIGSRTSPQKTQIMDTVQKAFPSKKMLQLPSGFSDKTDFVDFIYGYNRQDIGV